MKSIILKQKEERDKLMSIEYKERYLQNTAISFRDSKPIKLITGPRRAGKSILALLMLKDTKFAYLNFDDTALIKNFNEDSVEQALGEVYPGYEYLLLDEVQNIEGWSMWVEKLYRNGVNMIITGSNANLLSDDISAVLSGRFIEIRLFPFSAVEYMDYLGQSIKYETPEETANTNSTLDVYMTYGGYPEIIKTPQVTGGYLSNLYDAIIVRDIVQRYKIRKVDNLYNIAAWLLSNFTNTFSASSLAEELGMGSTLTIQKYCGYLQNTYLFLYLPRFNKKLKLMNKADRKAYVVDNGFVMARAFEMSSNKGRLFENMVFLELLKRGYNLKAYELFYYRSRNDRETDFVCRRGVHIEQLIQVCYEINSPKTRKREIDSIIECAEELDNRNLTIVTWDHAEVVEQNGYTINIIPIRIWLQNK